MERNGYTDAAVADILREAELSTRSFYRHFESKDQLLCALFRREADAAAARLRAKVEAAANPHDGLDAWIDEILSFGHDRVKAARVSVLGSLGAMKAEGYAHEMHHATAVLTAPLEALLRAGAADGSFPLADPRRRCAADSVGRLGRGGPASGAGQTFVAGRSGAPGCAPSASVRWERRPRRPDGVQPRRPVSERGVLGQGPEGRLAVLDLHHAVDLEDAQVRDRFPDGGPSHEARDVVPGPGPLHVLGDVPGAVRTLPQNGDHLAETLPVVLAQLLQPGAAGRRSGTRGPAAPR